MFFPSPNILEELVPELSILARSEKSSPQQIANFATLMQTAALRWLIERSLYDRQSDLFVEIESEWFDCATWMNKLCQKIPDARNRTIEYYLLSEYTSFYRERWVKSVIERYKIDSAILNFILNSRLFKVTDKSLRNNFQRLSKSDPPKLIKSGESRGKYKKRSDYIFEENYDNNLKLKDYTSFEEDFWDCFDEGVSAIAQLLLTKINGSQRLFLHAEYIFKEETQEIAEDWVDELRVIWRSIPIVPIKIKYYSASNNTTNRYTVYPVCLHYYQRAYYLSAIGENPLMQGFSEAKWYNYRLDRILNLEELSWNNCNRTQALRKQIYEGSRIKYIYTSSYIQEQLEMAYGFDFYRQFRTMVLLFDHKYEQKYVKNTIRHHTFRKIQSVGELEDIIVRQKENIPPQKIAEIIKKFTGRTYYQLDYRVGDYNVIMRLLSWGANVEVLLPFSLRTTIGREIELMGQIYQKF